MKMRPTALSCLAGITAVLVGSAFAGQTTYRWIDPKTGGTVISDQPPPPGAKQAAKSSGGAADGEEPAVPFAVKRASEKFPVVLYTSNGCETCKPARALLNGRGVPFSEKVIASEEELAELGKLLGGPVALPSIRVGRQGSSGFASAAWHALLDAAGYPTTAPYGSKRSGAATE